MAEAKEPLKVVIVQDGHNFKGAPSYWLDLDDDEDAEECVTAGLLTKQQQVAIEDGDHLTGFFNSKEEAVESAKKRGWKVTNFEDTSGVGEFGGKAP
jgi:hypothetical protein